jgi:hypothetical protein
LTRLARIELDDARHQNASIGGQRRHQLEAARKPN